MAKPGYRGRIAQGVRPFLFLLCGVLSLLAAEKASAMWAKMTEAELLQKSQWVVMGEWVGQSALKVAPEAAAAEVGVISVSEVLSGRPGAVAFVAVRGTNQPVSSSDVAFKRGDRGVWFLRLRYPADATGPFVVDHPQRFLRDAPENAAAISALRQQLQKR